jgi:glycosyltransferase involved in cell wall biosynthesis
MLRLWKPIVGTKVGSVPEIITSEDYGMLCEQANSKLVEKILIALDKKWDDEKIRENFEKPP